MLIKYLDYNTESGTHFLESLMGGWISVISIRVMLKCELLVGRARYRLRDSWFETKYFERINDLFLEYHDGDG